jgi:hypothetical protein
MQLLTQTKIALSFRRNGFVLALGYILNFLGKRGANVYNIPKRSTQTLPISLIFTI